jgi:AraC-like DNA-binding protein
MFDLISIGMIPEPIYKFDLHQHSVWEIVYYTHGTGTLRIGNEDLQFRPSVMICQPPGIPHCEYSNEGYRNIFFYVNNFNGFGSEIPYFTDTDMKDIYHLLKQIYREYHLRQKNWQNIVRSLNETVYQYMISRSSGKSKNTLVERFENILISNISNRHFKLDRSMESLPMSPDYLRASFKKETGLTPLKYLTLKRIQYAKNLLETNRMNSLMIKEVANQVGFSDPYYFSRVFKKVTGHNPTDWNNASE